MLVVGIGWVLVLGAFFVLKSDTKDDVGPTQNEMADAIGAEVMGLLHRGHVPGVSAQITYVPRPYRYMAFGWDLTTLGSDEPETFTAHSNPWAYLVRVPLMLYGPQLEPKETEVKQPVDLSQVAPTYAGFLGMDDFEADGAPLPGPSLAGDAPGAIVTIVMDGGGWNVLDEHPTSWPNIQEIAQQGISFTNATIGSAPAVTGAVHPTLGTGFYPKAHGIPSNPAWNIDDLRRPSVAELWDEANDNAPVIAATAFHPTHLGMIGHGSLRAGGDEDIAALWGLEKSKWITSYAAFDLPEYLATDDLGSLRRYERDLDERDGSKDDLWFGHGLDELRDPIVRPATPAFVRLNGDAALEIMENENIGRDEITDFLWVELKMPDYSGHQWNMVNPEVGDVVRAVDKQIGRLKKAIAEATGDRGYVLAITADHGQEPLAETEGGWRIHGPELERDVTVRFGDIVDSLTAMGIGLDPEAVEEGDVDVEEIARFLGDYTIGDNVPVNEPGAELVPKSRLDERLFAGAFTTEFLGELSPDQIESFGDSVYPQGRVSSEE